MSKKDQMDLKSTLKYLKMNESKISMFFGGLVIVILGFIVFNYYRNATRGQIQTGISTTQPTEQPIIQRGKGNVEYTIQKGETLWSISEKQYGTGYNWTDIAKENKISSPNRILTGNKLIIPDIEPKKLTVTKSEQTTTESISTSNYIVKKGDTLWNIAGRTYGDGNRWAQIAVANKLKNPNLIHSGNTLILPQTK